MGVNPAFPEPAPIGGSAVAPGVPPIATALMSAIAAVTVCWRMAGLVYPAETNPLTKLESKKPQMSVGNPASRSSGKVAAGVASDCSPVGRADVS
jgi:hypothetical protein